MDPVADPDLAKVKDPSGSTKLITSTGIIHSEKNTVFGSSKISSEKGGR
jgi:hypothetical protein